MDRAFTASLIRNHEGVRPTAYTDTVGLLTVGVGFNLQREGAAAQIAACGADYDEVCAGEKLTEGQIDALFNADLDAAIEDAKRCVSNFDAQPGDVQSAIVDMIFNLGTTGFKAFKNTITCLENKDYCGAAKGMLDSKWAKQVPNRAKDDVALVERFCESTTAS